MFYKLIIRNSKRNRKENGLLFASFLISIIAFYMILALSHQDLMLFLKRMESDAVDRLFTLIPLFFCMTLVLLFFLVYYASRFQMERRRHEFGVYLMMGMRRKRLFILLLMEDLSSSLIALLMGLPIAVLLSELISLITARLVGLGIVGHQFSMSLSAIAGTTIGFVCVKFLAMLILSGQIVRQEIGSLLNEVPEVKKHTRSKARSAADLLSGIVLLIIAYSLAICGLSWQSQKMMGITMLAGVCGTFQLFHGLQYLFNFLAAGRQRKKGLYLFTFRQLQELVVSRVNTLAVGSLLMLAALCSMGAGIAISKYSSQMEAHVIDYTFSESEEPEIIDQLKKNGLDTEFADLFEMRTGLFREGIENPEAFSLANVMDLLREFPQSTERDQLLNNLEYEETPYLIPLSDYNHLMTIANQPVISLGEREACIYIDSSFLAAKKEILLNQLLRKTPAITMGTETYLLTGEVQSMGIVADRAINLAFALIVPDETFNLYTQGECNSRFLNGVLRSEDVKEAGLMSAILSMNEKMDQADIMYESYLQNMGRQLFYVTAASYLTIYLAIIFLLIANTAIGVQFLTGQLKSKKRYQTLVHLGAEYQDLCQSAWRQIRWYFGIPIIIAVISSLFGVRALLSGLLSPSIHNEIEAMMMVSLSIIFVLCMVECCYMIAVKKMSNQNILKLMVPMREE